MFQPTSWTHIAVRCTFPVHNAADLEGKSTAKKRKHEFASAAVASQADSVSTSTPPVSSVVVQDHSLVQVGKDMEARMIRRWEELVELLAAGAAREMCEA